MDGEISPEEVEELLESGADVRLVDIRRPAAFERGHVPGSENVPFDRLPQEVDRLAGADHVVTICPEGKASVQAARLVESYEGTADARVESMAGGLRAWDSDLETGPEAAGNEEATDDVDASPAEAEDSAPF